MVRMIKALALAGLAWAFGLAAAQELPVEPGMPAAVASHEGTLVIYAATDARLVAPLIRDFESLYPDLQVEYHDMNSAELYRRFLAEEKSGGRADVTWSSAMDLQVKLVNDGHAQPHRSAETAALPAWAVWKNEAFGTTYEPIGIAYNKRLLRKEEVPATHADLIRLLNERPERFRGRLTAYDPVRSGLGFMLHTQDQQANPVVFWNLVQALGAVGLQGRASTSDMLDRIASGEALLGYNILGSYALDRARTDPALGVVLPQDYTLVMSRVMFIARQARHPNAARLWIDYILSRRGQAVLANSSGLFSIRDDVAGDATAARLKEQLRGALRPIAIGAGLLTYLDQMKRRDFLRKWDAAMQPR